MILRKCAHLSDLINEYQIRKEELSDLKGTSHSEVLLLNEKLDNFLKLYNELQTLHSKDHKTPESDLLFYE